MKCPNCGAEVNNELLVCDYCGSKIEPAHSRFPFRRGMVHQNNDTTTTTRRRKHTLAVLLISIFVITFIIPMFIGLFLFVRYDSFTSSYDSASSSYTSSYDSESTDEEEEMLTDKLPKSYNDLTGEVISCSTTGNATIEYNSKFYYDVKILDSELIEWLVDVGASLNGIGIMFSTNEDRNISEIALLSDKFIVMSLEGDVYTAYRDGDVITFRSDKELRIDTCYEGYFSYPDMTLHGGVTSDCSSSYLFDAKCAEKEEFTEPTTRSDTGTSKEVTVYKIRVGDTWYYCSKDTYDKVNVGDDLRDYTFTGYGYDYVY